METRELTRLDPISFRSRAWLAANSPTMTTNKSEALMMALQQKIDYTKDLLRKV